MGVRILYDAKQGQACLYSSSTDWAFGPVVFDGPEEDAPEQLLRFLAWLRESYRPPREHLVLAWRGDPRDLTDQGLERAWSIFRDQARRDVPNGPSAEE